MSKKSLFLILLFFLLLLIAISVGAFFFIRYQQTKLDLSQTKTTATNKEVEELVAKIGKIMVLPTGETPVLATVSDKTKLSNQDFFKNAKNGDKVLLYFKAKKAILYDPVAGKIIDIGPIYVPEPSLALPKSDTTGKGGSPTSPIPTLTSPTGGFTSPKPVTTGEGGPTPTPTTATKVLHSP